MAMAHVTCGRPIARLRWCGTTAGTMHLSRCVTMLRPVTNCSSRMAEAIGRTNVGANPGSKSGSNVASAARRALRLTEKTCRSDLMSHCRFRRYCWFSHRLETESIAHGVSETNNQTTVDTRDGTWNERVAPGTHSCGKVTDTTGGQQLPPQKKNNNKHKQKNKKPRTRLDPTGKCLLVPR